MRHYPHPYKELPQRSWLGSAVVLLALGALLGTGWRAYARSQHRRRALLP